MRHILAVFFALAATAAGASHYTITAIASWPPASYRPTDRFLVGPNASGAFTGHKDELASPSISGWTFKAPSPDDTGFLASTKKRVFYSGANEGPNGIFVGSRWSYLTPTRQRWNVGTKTGGSFSIGSADHGRWWWISPQNNATVTLGNPAAENQIAGIEWVAEVVTLEETVTFLVANGGEIRLANGDLVRQIVVPPLSYRRIRFTAGQFSTASTENHWYAD